MKICIIFLLILLLISAESKGSLGCMDNSYHLAIRCDYKNYHYVKCDCPCRDISDARGTCRKCYHFGRPFRGQLNSLQLIDFPIYR